MPLIGGEGDWRINRINSGPPYCVETVGPYKLSQVCDARGAAALAGPGGAVFCASHDLAHALCAQANAGQLDKA